MGVGGTNVNPIIVGMFIMQNPLVLNNLKIGSLDSGW